MPHKSPIKTPEWFGLVSHLQPAAQNSGNPEEESQTLSHAETDLPRQQLGNRLSQRCGENFNLLNLDTQ
jgi:hypothetical protein